MIITPILLAALGGILIANGYTKRKDIQMVIGLILVAMNSYIAGLLYAIKYLN